MSDRAENPSPQIRLVADNDLYAPFGAEHGDTLEWVEFQMREESLALPYHGITSIRRTALQSGDWFVTVVTPSNAVLVEGRHLGELIRGLRSRAIGFIQEFDPQRWPQPAEEEAVVMRLTFAGQGL